MSLLMLSVTKFSCLRLNLKVARGEAKSFFGPSMGRRSVRPPASQRKLKNF